MHKMLKFCYILKFLMSIENSNLSNNGILRFLRLILFEKQTKII